MNYYPKLRAVTKRTLGVLPVLLLCAVVASTQAGASSQAEIPRLIISAENPTSLAAARQNLDPGRESARTNPILGDYQLVEIDADLVMTNPDRVEISLREGPVVADRVNFEQRGRMSALWQGRITSPADVSGTVSLTLHGGHLVGHIQAGPDLYELSPDSGGRNYRLNRIDLSVAPQLEPEILLEAASQGRSAHAETGARVTPSVQAEELKASAKAVSASDPAVIDVMSVYTTQARLYLGSGRAIEARIVAAIDFSNLVFVNSNVHAKYRLVHMSEVDVDFSASSMAGVDPLNWVGNSKEVAALRDAHGADLVSFIPRYGSTYCGMAHLPFKSDLGDDRFGFQYSMASCLAIPGVMAHEHGHNLGLMHNSESAGGDYFRDAVVYPWAYGHYEHQKFHTAMSYSTFCQKPCYWTPHFSDPTIVVDGRATGVAGTANNALAARSTTLTVANLRSTRADDRPAPDWATPSDLHSLAAMPVTLSLAATNRDGQPVSYSAYRMPPGLSLNSTTGALSGTASSSGIQPVRFNAGQTAAGYHWVDWKFEASEASDEFGSLVLNEYNAVSDSSFLRSHSGSDPKFGRIIGNGGDWFELLVTKNDTDVRGWSVELWDRSTSDATLRKAARFTFSEQTLLANLTAGTLITVSQAGSEDLSYDPNSRDWSIGAVANGQQIGTLIQVSTQADFDTSSDNFHIVIFDDSDQIVADYAGETDAWSSHGNQLGDDQVMALCQSSFTSSLDYRAESQSSTFGRQNMCGSQQQDLDDLRGVGTGDMNGSSTVTMIDALLTAQVAIDLDPPNVFVPAGDVNRDGGTTMLDALLIAQCAVDLPNTFCPE